MADWRVLVVEDDRVVAGVHCRFVARVSGFAPVGVAQTAAQADKMMLSLRPDLLLLDIGLPGESGIALMRRMRARGEACEVIAVTAATASHVVRSVVQLGGVDYLVKPFDQDRLRKSLGLFQRRMAMFRASTLAQDQVDRICSDGPNTGRWLPRDLSHDRLHRVRDVLAAEPEPVSAAHVAAAAGIARVTARRYLEYLVTIEQAAMDCIADGPGRPKKLYWVEAPGPSDDAPVPRGAGSAIQLASRSSPWADVLPGSTE
jgi:response regulator of citrate/malate metabolism